MGDNLPVVNLGAGRKAKLLIAGSGHTCALLDNDAVKCWGNNQHGELGLGDTRNRGSSPNDMGDSLPNIPFRGPAFRHTILIDGVLDFSPEETFQTTTKGVKAYVTWDATHIYVGYSGLSVLGSGMDGYLEACFDVDLGGSNGSISNPHGMLASPLALDYCLLVDVFHDPVSYMVYTWKNGAFVTSMGQGAAIRSGGDIEVAIPLHELGYPQKAGLNSCLVFWGIRGSHSYVFGGIYPDNFADYDAPDDSTDPPPPFSRYLEIDMASSSAPNASGNMRP